MTMDEYVDYLERYVSEFKLDKKASWRFGTTVIAVRRVPLSSTSLAADYFHLSGSSVAGSDDNSSSAHWAHEVTFRNNRTGKVESDVFTHLCVCSGLHVDPNVPDIPGLISPLEQSMSTPSSVKSDSSRRTSNSSSTGREAKQGPSGSSTPPSDSDSSTAMSRGASETSAPMYSDGTIASSTTSLPSSTESAKSPSRYFNAPLSAEQKRIQTMHSSAYKEPSIYTGKSVMILGTGETGLDMAYEAVKAGAKEIVLCTRDGFLSFPAVLENFQVLGVTFDGHLPIDTLIFGLFEWSMVNRLISASRFRWWWSDRIIRVLLWCMTGTEAGCNQW